MRLRYPAFWIFATIATLALTTPSPAQIICVSNNVPPPELPLYDQPPIPAAGYIWTPGYWAGGPTGYFWVPGTWILPPTVGLLWTPGYWAWRDGIYIWNAGYWGPHVGFYGGINYGFGYGGIGYEGGHWDGSVFAYNRTVNNFGSVTIANVYEKTIVVDSNIARVSFNGGNGGTVARPTPEQEAAAHEQHVAAPAAQFQHERTASTNKSLLASENGGHPSIAATAAPADFNKGVVAARATQPETTSAKSKPAGAAAVGSSPSGIKPLEKGQQPYPAEATHNGETPPKSHSGEIKPLNTENKPGAPVERPLNTEAKPAAPEVKPLNTDNKSFNKETSPPGNDAKPVVGPAPKEPGPLTPKLATTPVHPTTATPHPAPTPPKQPADKKKEPN
jgi:WXXGXW repeat (2 copies)